MPVEEVEIAAVEEGQEEIREDERRAVEVNEIDDVHHAAPETEMPEERGHDDLSGALGMEPLQDEPAAEGETGGEAEEGPPAGAPIEPRDVGRNEGREEAFGGWVHDDE